MSYNIIFCMLYVINVSIVWSHWFHLMVFAEAACRRSTGSKSVILATSVSNKTLKLFQLNLKYNTGLSDLWLSWQTNQQLWKMLIQDTIHVCFSSHLHLLQINLQSPKGNNWEVKFMMSPCCNVVIIQSSIVIGEQQVSVANNKYTGSYTTFMPCFN